jgi:DMSO/TMAO reductase YedYZ molybdopterin-dependent catalytic subunit
MRPNRREVFASLLATSATARLSAQAQSGAQEPFVVPGKRPLILHNDRPEDLETPVRYLNTYLTSVDTFFVRQHLPVPEPIDKDAYRLAIDGSVSKPLNLALADLEKLPQYTVTATLECTGNGRAFYSPKLPGIQWGRGAVGTAEWRGPRLSDVLKLAGVGADAQFIEIDGADAGVASTPDFIRCMPLEKAMHKDTLLGLIMNGQAPAIHGFPARLVVPGWDGTSWVKWVVRLTAKTDLTTGFFMNPGYRYPKYALPPGTPARPAELEVIEGMPVKSTITAPEDQASAPIGLIKIRGFAWAGEEAIERVEVSTDGGSRWHDAELVSPKLPFVWRLWKFNWKPEKQGYHTVLSRATDSAGRIQPFVPAWNPSGYLWNGVDRVGVNVEKSA